MGDFGPILNEHFRLNDELDSLLREHSHQAAADVARRLVEIADQTYHELVRVSTVGIRTESGFIKRAGGPGFHAGYNYLCHTGYIVGVCGAEEAIAHCEQAGRQRWDGEWKQRIRDIKAHEKLIMTIKSIINETPGIIQSDMLKQYLDIDSLTLYYAAMRGEIVRIKKGRSYALTLPTNEGETE
ncbi:MAG: hypothetical protein M0R33_07175 [Methylomonas sp.]|uniref:hypothetical protein n=1 Tax=Methylomonas sp. TaxID=418 RepID=UPI0025F0D948|nr:hypothetical protein [Methylomonas sp.]MCK9606219.1 hypothetical protein [Methylomonas sp.]